MMKNLEVLEEIRKQGKNLIETKRDEFVKQNLLSDEFIQMMQKNKKPFELLMWGDMFFRLDRKSVV